MKIPWNIADLEIVGYADVLKPSMLPSVVPPVFRPKGDPSVALVPPYFSNAGLLYNATAISYAELQDLRDSHEISLFEEVFPAQPGFELWLDESFLPHYQLQERAGESLRQIAEDAMRQAEIALQKGDLDEA